MLTCVAVCFGNMITQTVAKIPVIAALPEINEILPVFVGTLTSGLLTIVLLYFMDNSPKVRMIVEWANKFSNPNGLILEEYQRASKELNAYVAKLNNIDIKAFEEKVEELSSINNMLYEVKDDDFELNKALRKISEMRNIVIPNLDEFMNQPNAVLKF